MNIASYGCVRTACRIICEMSFRLPGVTLRKVCEKKTFGSSCMNPLNLLRMPNAQIVFCILAALATI